MVVTVIASHGDGQKGRGETMSDDLSIDLIMSQKDRIGIILEEYKTLRSEMIERHTAFMQLFALATSAMVATIGLAVSQKAWLAGVSVCVAVVAGVAIGALILDHDSRVLSTRLQEIEADINSRTKDQLLRWETTRGIEQYGYIERLLEAWKRLRR